jgi:rhodanese-related sulfurtransferase
MTDQNTHKPIRISIEDARERYEKGEATVLDVVDTDAYQRFPYKIQGAVRINPEDVPDEFSRLPKDRSVLTY